MFRRIHLTKEVLLKFFPVDIIRLTVFLITFALLLPSNFVEALAEIDDEAEHEEVELLVYLLCHCEEVQSKYFVHFHFQFVMFGQVVVVSVPAQLLPTFLLLYLAVFFTFFFHRLRFFLLILVVPRLDRSAVKTVKGV